MQHMTEPPPPPTQNNTQPYPPSPLAPTSLSPPHPIRRYTIFEWPLLQMTSCRKFLFKIALLPEYFRPQIAILHYVQILEDLISHIETICSWRPL